MGFGVRTSKILNGEKVYYYKEVDWETFSRWKPEEEVDLGEFDYGVIDDDRVGSKNNPYLVEPFEVGE